MDISPIQMLCAAVVERAVDDYRLLNEKGKELIENKDEGDFSREEIESFFRSDWCRTLLRGADSRIEDGVQILRNLKSETA